MNFLLFPIIGFVMTLDRLPLPFGPGYLPPIYLFALLYNFTKILSLDNLSLKTSFIPIFGLLSFFSLYSILIMIFSANINIFLFNEFRDLLIQIFLILNLSVFFTSLFSTMKKTTVISGLAIGFLPCVLVGFINFLWGVSGVNLFGQGVQLFRSFVELDGVYVFSSSPLRASGFSNEPSSFGVLLAFLIIPIYLLKTFTDRQKKNNILIIFAVFAFFWTFSSTSWISSILAFFLVIIIFLDFKKLISFSLFTLMLGLFLFFSFNTNYVVSQLTLVYENFFEYLRMDPRIGSSSWIFFTRFDLPLIFGTGAGSVVEYGENRLEPDFYFNLHHFSWGSAVNLKTLFGRMVFDYGLIGVSLFYFFVIFFCIKNIIKNKNIPTYEKKITLYCFFGFLLYSLVAGSLINPILWFWLAWNYTEKKYDSFSNNPGSLPTNEWSEVKKL